MDDAAVHNFTMRQGSDFTASLSWSTDSDPWDFTGATLALQARTTPVADDAVLSLSGGDGLSVDGGTITIAVTGAQLEDIPARQYGYDLKVTYPGGTQAVLITGSLTVEAEYTRA